MNPHLLLQTEQELQKEAKVILQNKTLWEPFWKKGKIIPCGSYDLGLLVYGDLDVYFESNDPGEEGAFAESMQRAALCKQVKTIRFERDFHLREPKVPKGLYLQFKFDNGVRVWQIDIWSVGKTQQEAVLKEHEARKAKLTPQMRELILTFKHALMQDKGKTPSFAGFYVYQAVLEEGLKDIDEIKAYLVKHGIKLFC